MRPEGWRRRLTRDDFAVLEPHAQWGEVQLGDTEALRDVVERAQDERALQQLLAQRSHLFAAIFLSGGHGRYVRPQVRLGSEWVADFMLADASSMGVFWTLVELESPQAPMFLRSGELAEKARHAVYQIHSWRHWLKENLDYARKAPKAGLGLADIDPRPDALVFVGRRGEDTERHNWLRKQLWEGDRIRLHTYDHLIDAVARDEKQTLERIRRFGE